MEEVIGAGGVPYKGKNVQVPTPAKEPAAAEVVEDVVKEPAAAEVVEDVVEKTTKRIGRKNAR